MEDLSSECEAAVQDGKGDTLVFPKKIICGRKDLVEEVTFLQWGDNVPDKETDPDGYQKALDDWTDTNVFTERYGSVEEMLEYFLEKFDTLAEQGARIRAIGCYVAGGKLTGNAGPHRTFFSTTVSP